MVKKISDLFNDARKALLSVEEADRATMVARNLVAHVTGKTQAQILVDRELYVGDETCAAMDAAVARLLAGEPLAYVLGEWEFYGMTLYVDHNVLIPRDDTVAVTELAIRKALFLEQAPRILDLCTGSGCIGLAVASRVRDAKVTLADISKDALAVARKNITAQHQTGRVMAVQADALGKPNAFLGKFDMIISNPPYIDSKDMEELDISVKDYEPHLALFGGNDGLDFYRAIAENFKAALKPGGYLCFEFGDGQGDDVCAILEHSGYTILERTNDYNGVERAVLAQWKED